METYRCRPCQKDYAAAALNDPRRCPQCQGPLLTHAELRGHDRATREALDRLRGQSALTMGASALLMLVMQGVLSFLQSAEVAGFFNGLTLGVAAMSIVAAALWQITAQKLWMLAGAILLQTAAALFFFVVMGTEQQALGQLGGIAVRWTLCMAALPMAGALLAWHQFRSYSQLLKLEQGKSKGCQTSPA